MTTITTRSGKGSPLTNNEVDANFTNLNDDKVEASGDSMTGNLSFGDNNKVILGSGNDLQLYHDGSASYITDTGTGTLNIKASGSIRLRGNDTDELLARFNENGSNQFYYDSSEKLATTSSGIDVTGTATMDGLTVDGSATITQSAGSDFLKFDVDGTTDEAILGIDSTDFIIDIDPTNVRASSNFVVKNDGTTNLTLDSSGDLDVNGTVTADGLTVDGATDGTAVALFRADNNGVTKKNTLRFEDTDTTTQNDQQIGRIEFYSNDTDHTGVDAVIEAVSATTGLKELRFLTSDTANTPLSRLAINKSGDISFYEDTGTTAKLTWDASAETLNFADNAKAVFGSGSDLSIFHDGSGSVIRDSGTGNLAIQAEDFAVQSSDASATHIFVDASNGYTSLSYGGSTRLNTSSTGIDVTGTIVGDGLDLTVGTNDRTLLREFNSVNNLSSVNAANSAFRPFEISALGTTISYGGPDTLITGNNTVNFYLNSGSISHGFQYNENGGELALYDDTGTAATLLDQANNNTRLLELIDGSNIQIGIGGSNTTGALIFTKASGNEFGRITGSGFFGINNTNPDTTLHIGDISATNATGQGQIKLEASSGDIAHDAGLEFVGSSFGSGYGWKLTTIDSSGVHLGFGTRQNATAWSEKMRLLSDGRVAINDTTTNNTANRLKVQGSQGDDRIAISTANTSSNASVEAQVANYWSGTTYTGTAIVQYDSAASGTTAGISNANLGMLRFQNGSAGLILTNGSQPIHFGTVGTTRMTLDASGNLLVGTTDTDPASNNVNGFAVSSDGVISASKGNEAVANFSRRISDGDIAVFKKGGTAVGSISVTASATAYNTSSDQRLKDNIVDAPSASDDIDAIQVRSFDWKVNGEHQKYGMVAQELNTVAPDAVTIPDDPEEMAGVDYSKLVPMLVKEIQSLRARVAQLEGAN